MYCSFQVGGLPWSSEKTRIVHIKGSKSRSISLTLPQPLSSRLFAHHINLPTNRNTQPKMSNQTRLAPSASLVVRKPLCERQWILLKDDSEVRVIRNQEEVSIAPSRFGPQTFKTWRFCCPTKVSIECTDPFGNKSEYPLEDETYRYEIVSRPDGSISVNGGSGTIVLNPSLAESGTLQGMTGLESQAK